MGRLPDKVRGSFSNCGKSDFLPEKVKARPLGGAEVWFIHKRMLPGFGQGDPGVSPKNGALRAILAIRTESLVDFIAAHDLATAYAIRFGEPIAAGRRTSQSENGFELRAVERVWVGATLCFERTGSWICCSSIIDAQALGENSKIGILRVIATRSN